MSKENLLLVQKIVNILAAIVLLLVGLGSLLQLIYVAMVPNYQIDPYLANRGVAAIGLTLSFVILLHVGVTTWLRQI